MRKLYFRFPKTILGLIAAALQFPASAMGANDWTQWRGSQRDGTWHEKVILPPFAEEGLKVLWRTAAGAGFSSPCVAEEKVFLTDSHVAAGSCKENISSFEAHTGRLLWKYSYAVDYPEYGADPAHPFGPVATPVVQGGRIYSLGRMMDLVCLDAADGSVVWHHSLRRMYGTTEDLRGGNSSPLIEGDLVVVCVAKNKEVSVAAFHRDTGLPAWESLAEIPSDSSPIVITAAGRRQLVVWAYRSVAALDPATGEVLWQEEINSGPTYPVATPVWNDDRLLLGGLMLKLNGDKPGATVLWPAAEDRKPRRIHVSDTSTAIFFQGLILSPDRQGNLHALEPSTGNALWIQKNISPPGPGASLHLTAVPHCQSLLIFTDRGELILAKSTAEGYSEISRARLIDPSYLYVGRKMAWSPPAFAAGCVFVRSDRELICARLAEPLPD